MKESAVDARRGGGGTLILASSTHPVSSIFTFSVFTKGTLLTGKVALFSIPIEGCRLAGSGRTLA